MINDKQRVHRKCSKIKERIHYYQKISLFQSAQRVEQHMNGKQRVSFHFIVLND